MLSQNARIHFNKILDESLEYVEAHTLPPHIDMWCWSEVNTFIEIFFDRVSANHELSEHFHKLITRAVESHGLMDLKDLDIERITHEVIKNHEWIAHAVPEYKAARRAG